MSSYSTMKLYINSLSITLQTPTGHGSGIHRSKLYHVSNMPVLMNLSPDLFIKNVKDKIQTLYFIPTHNQRLFKNQLELANKRTLEECGLNDGDTITLIVSGNNGSISQSESMEHLNRQIAAANLAEHHSSVTLQQLNATPALINVLGSLTVSPYLNSLIHQSCLGLSLGLKPKLTEDGTGGTYLLRNAQKQHVAVFKPKDEELFASENPRGYNSTHGNGKIGDDDPVGDCRGIVPSEGAVREVAAFLLDRNRFAGVPQTTYVSVSRSVFDSTLQNTMSGLSAAIGKNRVDKVGSFQEYVESDDTAGDVSSSLFPVREVHKIAILDMRILNVDRNESNILVRRVKSSGHDRNSTGTSSSNSSDESASRPITPSTNSSGPYSRYFSHPIAISPPKLNLRRETTGESEYSESGHRTDSPARGFYMDQIDSSPLSGSPMFPTNRPNQQRSSSVGAPFDGLRSILDNSSQSVPSRPPSALYGRQRSNIQLVPIDHSRSLPDQIEIAWDSWCWLEWSQLKEPLDQETKQYVAEIDILADLEMLRNTLGIREDCLRMMRITNMCLQKGVIAGLSLYDIAMMISRSDFEVPSALEMLCAQAKVFCKAVKNNARRVERLRQDSIKVLEDGEDESSTGKKRVNDSALHSTSSPIAIGSSELDSLSNIQPMNRCSSHRSSVSSECSTTFQFGSLVDDKVVVPKLTAQEHAELDAVAHNLALRRSISFDDFRIHLNPNGFKSTEISKEADKTRAYKINNVHHHEESLANPARKYKDGELFSTLSLNDVEVSELFFACLSQLLDSEIERTITRKRAKGELVDPYILFPKRQHSNSFASTVQYSQNSSSSKSTTSSPSLSSRSRRRLDGITVRTNSSRCSGSPVKLLNMRSYPSQSNGDKFDHDSIFLLSSASPMTSPSCSLQSINENDSVIQLQSNIAKDLTSIDMEKSNDNSKRSLQQIEKIQYKSKDDLASLINQKHKV